MKVIELHKDDTNLHLKLKIQPDSREEIEEITSKEFNLLGSLVFQVKNEVYYLEDLFIHVISISLRKTELIENIEYIVKLTCPKFVEGQLIINVDNKNWRTIVVKESKSVELELTLQVEKITRSTPFSVLYEDKLLTDFKIHCEDGEINIHKVILASTSEKFRSMLIDDQSLTSLTLPDTNVSVLVDFKKSIYFNTLPNDNLQSLLMVLTFFQINWLVYKCVDKIMSNMSSVNATDVIEFALKHKHVLLFMSILDHVQNGNLKVNEIRKHYVNAEKYFFEST